MIQADYCAQFKPYNISFDLTTGYHMIVRLFCLSDWKAQYKMLTTYSADLIYRPFSCIKVTQYSETEFVIKVQFMICKSIHFLKTLKMN